MSKIYCACCAKQFVTFKVSDRDDKLCNTPAKSLGFGQWACSECSKDLDENGLFPNERALYEMEQP
jgi:hypothetical protein